MSVEDYINEQRELLLKRQRELIEKYPARYCFDLLFDLATVFEGFYASYDTNTYNLQQDTQALGRLIFELLDRLNFTTDKRKAKQIQEKWKKKIKKQAQDDQWGQDLPLANLLLVAVELRALEEVEDTNRDGRYKVSITDGEPTVEVVDPMFWQEEQATARKYEFEIAFYQVLGIELASYSVREEKTILPGLTALDAELSLEIIGWEEATTAYLEHYGIEEKFKWQGQTFQRTMLIRMLALWVVYYQGRYELFFSFPITDGMTIPQAIHETMENLELMIEEPLGPLVVMEWEDLLQRLKKAFRNTVSTKTLEHHLKFFVPEKNIKQADFSLFQTPLLRKGDKAVLFLRPLMGQNTWTPIVQRLIGNKKENHRIAQATKRLADLFRPHDFRVLIDEKIYDPETKRLITDIDIAALKDGHLFLFEMKMTRPRVHAKEYRNHLKIIFGKACEQLDDVVAFLSTNWEDFRSSLGSTMSWEEIKVHRIILSSSFEADRSKKLLKKGLWKISMFELERYLRNDAALMFDVGEEESVQELQGGFYSIDEHLSGQRLWELIEGNVLWTFLEK